MNKLVLASSALVLMAAQSLAQAEIKLSELAVSGLVEIEMSQNSGFTGTEESDVAVATVELGFEAQINKEISTAVVMLHEDGDDSFAADTVMMNYQPANKPWSITAGRTYLPFARFESYAVSDPLTLEMGESQEAIVQLNTEFGNLGTAVYFYNGDDKTNKTSADNFDNLGLNLTYQHQGSIDLAAGLSYLNDMSNIDVFQDVIAAGTADDYVAAYALDLLLQVNEWSVIVEHVQAAKRFEESELSFAGRGAQPSGSRIEVAYQLMIWGQPSTLALAQQLTKEAQALDMPANRQLLALSFDFKQNTSLAFELSRDSDYSIANGGSGETASAFTAQLAIEF